MITVKFFGKLREELEQSELRIEYIQNLTAADVWTRFADKTSVQEVLCACNHSFCPLDTRLGDGDEVAFMPPVTGG